MPHTAVVHRYVNHDLIVLYSFIRGTAATYMYSLCLHDALPISAGGRSISKQYAQATCSGFAQTASTPNEPGHQPHDRRRSEEHTSELQSPCNLVCRLRLEKKQTSRENGERTSAESYLHSAIAHL